MGRRAFVCFTLLFATLSCGGSTTATQTNTTTTATPSAAAGTTVQIKETEYTIDPPTLTLKPGTYTFQVRNSGQFPHDVHIANSATGTELGKTPILRANQTGNFTVTLDPGAYTVWCSVDAHRTLGMQSALTVG